MKRSWMVWRCRLRMDSLMTATSAFISCTSARRLGLLASVDALCPPSGTGFVLVANPRSEPSFCWRSISLLTAPFSFSNSFSSVTWGFWRHGFNSSLILSVRRAVSKGSFWRSLSLPLTVPCNRRAFYQSLKKPLLRQKDDYIPQIRYFSVYLSLIYMHS